MLRWLAASLAVILAGASMLLAAWGLWLVVDPHEEIHFEVAVPALLMAAIGAVTAVLLWRRGV